jgi:hypothetical protein
MRNLHAKEPCRNQLRSYFVSGLLDNLSSCAVTVKRDLDDTGTSDKLLRTCSSSTNSKSVHTDNFPASIGYQNHAKTE